MRLARLPSFLHGGLLALLAAAAAAGSVQAARAASEALKPVYPYPFEKDVVYGWAGGQSLKLDFSMPEGPGPFPVAILVHGGGWVSGDKETYGCRPLFRPLHEAGFAWFSINYRLAPRNRYPACVEDVESAIRWVRFFAAADHRIDPARIVLIGESAGGHLVDEAAVRAVPATRVAAVVAFYAPCDLVDDTRRRGGLSKATSALFGIRTFDGPAERVLWGASPLNFVNAGLPPFLLLHGTADKTVPYAQSVEWQARLRGLHVPCELITIPGAPHAMAKWDSYDPAYPSQVVGWLMTTLGLRSASAPAPAPTPSGGA